MSNETCNDDTEIRILAYELWEQASCPEGRDKEFWDEASRSIAERVMTVDPGQCKPDTLAA